MASDEIIAGELRELIDASFEWLLVRGNGRAFPVRKTELDISHGGQKVLFDFVDDQGVRTHRVRSFEVEGREILLETSSQFGRGGETIRLVPRTPASELAAEVETARLAKANTVARSIEKAFSPFRASRVAMNSDNGRLAQISLETRGRPPAVAIADVTDTVRPELLLTAAEAVLRNSAARRKRPFAEAWLIAEKKRARELQKLRSLLRSGACERFRIFEFGGEDTISERPTLSLSDLWREKPKKLKLPSEIEHSATAQRILRAAPDEIDVVASRYGETLRFRGLPFARVRRLMGREQAWLGIGQSRRLLTDENWDELQSLIDDLAENRSPAANQRNELFRAAPEAWLESILRQNIKLLDANLILSPLYHQFRASSDRIDLLAIRRDGRIVIIELKTSPDRETVFQAADYWRKIELQRRRGELAAAFTGMQILDRPALVYLVAPALSFHRDVGHFARMLVPDIELWRFELHQDWRRAIKVLARRNYSGIER